MSIRHQVLGSPGRDNAVYVEIDSGQSVSRLLFDCGYGCTDQLTTAQLQSLDGLFISHFHMDHVCGFDQVFRFNFGREPDPFLILGPQDTTRAISHRLQGFTWNLVRENNGSVEIREMHHDQLNRSIWPTRNRFENPSSNESIPCDGTVFQNSSATVRMIEMDHGCVSAGYRIQEPKRVNVDVQRMNELDLTPGPWLQELKASDSDPDQMIQVGDQSLAVSFLKDQLLKSQPGESLAYLTDFRTTQKDRQQLVEFIRGVDVLICENNYCDNDLELAIQNYHLTSSEVGMIAADAGVKQLVLFHLSDRYPLEEWRGQIEEVKAHFPNTHWPEHWTGLNSPN